LKNYGVDYDVFASSYYPEYHGSLENLKEQLSAVHNIGGKKVMIAETSWAYSSDVTGAYKNSVQGQADEIRACVNAMKELGDYAIGVFYWEPAWIDVPGDNETDKFNKREQYGAGWASSYAGSYEPKDAGQYYGATACIPTSLFSPEGYPLESLKTFYFVREGTKEPAKNYVKNPSFEESDTSMWKITEVVAGTTDYQEKQADAKDGVKSLHFWSDQPVEFCAEQTITSLKNGKYKFSLSVQGDAAGDAATLLIYVISDGVRYEQAFTLAGWVNWQEPSIDSILCSSGTMKIGIEVKAAAGAWGTIDCVELIYEED
jgi:arabinogalactan endo-1,4-beta-galactosidase